MLKYFLFLFGSFSISAQAGHGHFNGMFGVERQSYFSDLGSPTRKYDHLIHFRPEYDYRFNRKTHFFFKPFVRANTSTDRTPENFFLNIKEAFLEIKTYPLRTHIGMNTHNWGVMDIFSPADVIDGRVLFNPLVADKRGTPSVDIQYERNSFQFLFLYIPQQARTILPSTDSRWLPRRYITSGSTVDGTIVVPPSTFNYFYSDYEELNNALKNNFGVKLSGQVDSMDLSLSFFQGSGINPELVPDVATILVEPGPPPVFVANSDIGLRAIYFRQNIFSFTFVRAFEKLILKFESTYAESISKSTEVSPRYSQTGMGIEVPWSMGSRDITTFFQIYYGDNKKTPGNVLNSSTRIFDRVAILGSKAVLNSKTNLVLSIMHDYSSDGYFIHSSLDRKLNRKIKAEVAIDVIGGKQQSLLNTYGQNDRLNLGLSYLW